MTKHWNGQCHCGFVTFEVQAEIDHVRICDCSICHQRGALIHRVAPGALQLHRPLSDLRCYRWGSCSGADYFCPQCGILPFRKPSLPTSAERAKGLKPFDGWAINTRCLTGFDPAGVPVVQVQGRLI